MRSVVLLMACLLLGSSRARADGPPWAALADEAVQANPSLEAMRARERALRERAEVAGARMDPMVSVELSNLPVTTFSLADHGMAGVQLRAQQTLRPPTWSRLQRELGEQRADAAGFATAEAELQLRGAVERAWWTLARTRMLAQVTEEHLARTEQLLDAARARYETGGVGQYAVLRLGVLRDKLRDDLGDFIRGEAELEAALSAALDRAPGGPFPTPTAVEPVAPPADADWVALASATRPALLRIAADREVALQTAHLARVDVWPDVTLWAGYRLRTAQSEMDPGTDLVSVGVGVPIPGGSARRADGDRAAALEEASGAAASYDAALNGVEADMAGVIARWSRAWDKVAAYDQTLIPGARSTLEATRADFVVGRAEFASLIDAEVALLDLERARITAAVETHLQRADAVTVLGAPPPPGPGANE